MSASAPIKVLLVEDQVEDAELLLREMRARGLSLVARRVESRQDFTETLAVFAPDLILSDYTLPGFDGIDALEIAQAQRPDTPFIFVSGTIGEERAIQALKQGAVDYVLKSHRGRLVPAIERALREAEDRDARRWAQRELEESEERFRFAMHFSSVGMALVAPDGRWLSINPALCDIVGYGEGELLSSDVQSISHPEDRDVDRGKIADMLARRIATYQVDKRFVRKDARVVWTQISASLVWLRSGEPHYFILQIQDITDRVRAERALRASEERFRSIAEATQEWIWELDPAFTFTFCSPAVEAILGHSPQRLLGGSALDLVAVDMRPAAADLLKNAIAEKRGWRDRVMQFRHAAGGVRWVETSVLPLEDAAGEVRGLRGVARDITDSRLQQERIARLSRIQAVLSGINAAIVRVRDRRELLGETCRIAVRQGGFRMAWVGVVDPGAAKATPLVWDGHEQGYLDEMTRALAALEADPGPVGEALRHGRIVVINDIEGAEEPWLRDAAVIRGFRSQAAMPLTVEGRVVATLVLFADEAGFFDYEELKLLKDLTGDISFALDFIGKEEKLAYVSYYDTLTGLANRQLLFDRLSQSLQAAHAEGRPLAVILLDLQRFKRVNDTLGRHAGDQVLKEIGARLQRAAGESGTSARIGGDRFALVVPNLAGPSMARWIEERVVEIIAGSLVIDAIELRIAVKIGIALYPADADSAEGLFVNAEAALMRAKAAAESYVFYSPEMNARVAHRLRLESRLRRAAAQREFTLHYQAKVDLETRKVRGLEALIRWEDSDLGPISPLDFVPLLEETGLIVEVGAWVFERAVADMDAWRELGLEVPRVAVNVSEVQIRQPGFVATVLEALATGTRRAAIDIEITESMLAQNAGANVKKLQRLREAGVRVYMDDFGTGYSGLSQIAQLPLDALKIDRAFVAGMTESAEHAAIVSAIVNLAQALRISVVAEGVETEEQAVRLLELGCHEAQGYLFGRPGSPKQIVERLKPAH